MCHTQTRAEFLSFPAWGLALRKKRAWLDGGGRTFSEAEVEIILLDETPREK